MIALPPSMGVPFAALAYVLPGLALVRHEEWRRADPVELAAVACAGSIAWWAVGCWFLGWLRLPLSVFALGMMVAAALVLVLRRRNTIAVAVAAWCASPAAALWSFGFIVAVVGTRAIFAFTRLACSVGDMSAHAYIAELIVMRNGLPETYDPFLPISGFGSFPPGFHALAAIETLLGGIPTYRSTIHVLCFSLVALTFTLAALLRRFGVGRAASALGSAGALVLARNPQFFEQWGGGPTLLAAALVFLVLRDGLRLDNPCPASFLGRLGLLSAGALLTHQLPVASFLYVFPVLVLCASRDRTAWLRLVRNGIVVLAIASAIALPFLGRMPRSIPPEVAAWARDWFQSETKNTLLLQGRALHALGTDSLSRRVGPHTWPFYILTYLGLLPTAILVLGLILRWLRERDLATKLATALLGIHAILFTGAITETLPLWPLLYPTRIGIWLMPSLAVALAGLGRLASRYFRRRTLGAVGVMWLGLFAVEGFRLSAYRFGIAYYEAAKAGDGFAAVILANEALGGAFWVAIFNRDNAVLTVDDLRAFAWIAEHTPLGVVFATNSGDGGQMIPSIAHRAVIDPHFNLRFFYRCEIDAWQRRTPVDYIYVGSEASPAYPRRYTAEELDRDPSVELVFHSREARVYKLKRPVRFPILLPIHNEMKPR